MSRSNRLNRKEIYSKVISVEFYKNRISVLKEKIKLLEYVRNHTNTIDSLLLDFEYDVDHFNNIIEQLDNEIYNYKNRKIHLRHSVMLIPKNIKSFDDLKKYILYDDKGSTNIKSSGKFIIERKVRFVKYENNNTSDEQPIKYKYTPVKNKKVNINFKTNRGDQVNFTATKVVKK